MMSAELPDTPTGEFLLYTTGDGKARVECRFENEMIWLSQALMAELFETTPQNITLHLKGLVGDGEIAPGATCMDDLQVRSEGERKVKRRVKHDNPEVILAGGILLKREDNNGQAGPNPLEKFHKNSLRFVKKTSRV